MADLFACERKGCGHPMNRHNPCNAPVGKGKRRWSCGCPAFLPEDRAARMARLTDTADERVPPIHEVLTALGGSPR